MYSIILESVLASIISCIPVYSSIFFILLNKHGIKQVAKLASFIYCIKIFKTLFSIEYLAISLKNLNKFPKTF